MGKALSMFQTLANPWKESNTAMPTTIATTTEAQASSQVSLQMHMARQGDGGGKEVGAMSSGLVDSAAVVNAVNTATM
jgi:hypothetical protein